MNDGNKKNMSSAIVVGNFLCLGLCLAYASAGPVSGVTPVTSQISILILLALTSGCAFMAKFVLRRLEGLSKVDRKTVVISTFVFTGGAANVVLSPHSPLSIFIFIPFALLFMLSVCQGFAGPPDQRLERFATILCQIMALSLVLKVSESFPLCFLISSLAVCGLHFYAIQNSQKKEMAAVVLSPIMVLWFFLNLSNQLANSYSGASAFFLVTAVVCSVVIIAAGLAMGASFPGQAKTFNRVCMSFFAASLILDVNVEAGMSTPLHLLDFHLWIHVAPGLDAIYTQMKPFIHYIPFEGYIFETMLPRIWFVFMNQTMGGFFVLMAVFCFVSQGVYAILLYILLRQIFSMKKFSSALIATLLVVTNIPLLQTGYPFPGAWTIAERALACFAGCALFTAAYFHQQHKNASFKLLSFIVGGVHIFSYFFEPLFGLACIAGLLGTMILAPESIGQKRVILLGGFVVLVVFLAVLGLPLYVFFVHQPFALIHSGAQTVGVGQGKHIFEVFFRKRILLTFQYSITLAALTSFLAMLSTKMRQHPLFGISLYFFLATLFMFISGGQRFFGEPGNSYGAVHFVAMSSVLVIPLILCLIRIGADLVWSSKTPKGLVVFAGLSLLVFLVSTDGLYHGMAPGPYKARLTGHQFQATDWKGQEKFFANHSDSLDSVIRYYFKHKSRSSVASGPKPLPMHYMPYSAWRDKVSLMPPVKDVLMFISMSKPPDKTSRLQELEP